MSTAKKNERLTVEYWQSAPNNCTENEAALQIARFKHEAGIFEPGDEVAAAADHASQNEPTQRGM